MTKSKDQIKTIVQHIEIVDKCSWLVVLYLEAEQRIIGSCKLYLEKYSSLVQDLFVSESYRRKGWGEELIRGCLRLAKNEGKKSVTCYVRKDNENIEFYRSIGFVFTDEDYENYIMSKILEL